MKRKLNEFKYGYWAIKSYYRKAVGHIEQKPTFSATKVGKYAVTITLKEKPELKRFSNVNVP